MINLTKKQQADTFVALYDARDIGSDLNNSEAVKHHAYAELLAYYLPLVRVVESVANVIRRTMFAAKDTTRLKYWRCDIDELAELVGSYQVARLALGVCGFWFSKNNTTGQSEWSTCDMVGGDRNDVRLPAYLARFRLSDQVAA